MSASHCLPTLTPNATALMSPLSPHCEVSLLAPFISTPPGARVWLAKYHA